MNEKTNPTPQLPSEKAAATGQRIKAQVERPENCRVCPAAAGCRSWYGGTTCAYKNQIP